jgi:hypothetical protein
MKRFFIFTNNISNIKQMKSEPDLQKNTINNPKENEYKSAGLWIGLIAILLVIAILYVIFIPQIDSPTTNSEKLNLIDSYISDDSLHSIKLYRLVKPLTEEEVDQMDIEEWQKILIKKNLNHSEKPHMMDSGFEISIDTLRKYRTAFVGAIAEDFPDDYKNDYNALFPIKPNDKALVVANIYNSAPPSGYSWIYDTYYIESSIVTSEK